MIDLPWSLWHIVYQYVKHPPRWRRRWIWKAPFQTWRKGLLGWNKSSNRDWRNCRLWRITTKPKHKATILNFRMKTTPRWLKVNLPKKMTTQLLMKKLQMLVSLKTDRLIFHFFSLHSKKTWSFISFHFTLKRLSFNINIGELVGWQIKALKWNPKTSLESDLYFENLYQSPHRFTSNQSALNPKT